MCYRSFYTGITKDRIFTMKCSHIVSGLHVEFCNWNTIKIDNIQNERRLHELERKNFETCCSCVMSRVYGAKKELNAFFKLVMNVMYKTAIRARVTLMRSYP